MKKNKEEQMTPLIVATLYIWQPFCNIAGQKVHSLFLEPISTIPETNIALTNHVTEVECQ